MNDDRIFDPVLLRSFLAVAETLHFTEAARRLGVSQSTISQHVGRLEDLLQRTLLLRSTKSVALTPDGGDLADLARDILAAQDRAAAHFQPDVVRGRVRFGVSEDLVLSHLPDLLRAFRAEHPMVDVDLTFGLSFQLHEMLGAGRLDLMLAKRQVGDERGLLLWRERLRWFGNPEALLDRSRPLPLVVLAGRSSVTREAATAALDRAGRSWHVAFSSASVVTLIGAVRAGFGVTAQTSLLAGAKMDAVTPEADLPALAEVEFVVLWRGAHLRGAAAALARAIRADGDLLTSRLSFISTKESA